MATARRFAATLGVIAFLVVVGFGMWRHTAVNAVLLRALLALVIFSALGFVAGLIGAAIAQHSAASEVDRAEAAERMRRERLKEERVARERDRAGSRAPREGVGVAPRTGKDDAA